MVIDRFADEGRCAMNGYIALYRGKRAEVYAEDLGKAKDKAVAAFKAKKAYEVSVYLAERGGQIVQQATT